MNTSPPLKCLPKILGQIPSFLILVAVAVALAESQLSGAEAPVLLGQASNFGVLAGSGITNTGPTTIIGDVGTFPTSSITGFGSVTLTGTNHGGDAIT
jgi:hypothetical protein